MRIIKWLILTIQPSRFFKFCLVGGTGALLGLALLYVLTEYLGLFYLLSLAIGWVIVSILVYLGNCKYTFHSFQGIKGLWKFVGSRMGTTIAGFGLVAILTSGFNIHYMLSPVIGTLIMTLFNYFIAKRWIWHQKGLTSV